ncbi:hypothetical protein, partial [Croceivirga radicis]|uniref:hypothetical protein n=1 Tax=Croceivirga radicis TaxID=1929488 RepID=UPI000255B12B
MYKRNYPKRKSLLPVLLFLFTGFAFAQTTVTLQDQCNCEVLSGTEVSAPGMATPAGADVGDIYVNTNTGTIYYWDGDSWELTSSDDQQLQNFTFDNNTGELSLSLENGGTATVILPVETITSLTNTLGAGNTIGEYTNENGDVVSILETITTIQDNGDGNITFVNEAGTSITVAKSAITDLGNGVYQFTNGDGTDVTLDTRASSNPYDNTTSGLAATDVQAAIDEINAAAGTVALVDNGDGTYVFTDASGATT